MTRIVVVGDAGLDVLAAAATLPEPGGDARAAITLRPGGAGANTAAWPASSTRHGAGYADSRR